MIKALVFYAWVIIVVMTAQTLTDNYEKALAHKNKLVYKLDNKANTITPIHLLFLWKNNIILLKDKVNNIMKNNYNHKILIKFNIKMILKIIKIIKVLKLLDLRIKMDRIQFQEIKIIKTQGWWQCHKRDKEVLLDVLRIYLIKNH